MVHSSNHVKHIPRLTKLLCIIRLSIEFFLCFKKRKIYICITDLTSPAVNILLIIELLNYSFGNMIV